MMRCRRRLTRRICGPLTAMLAVGFMQTLTPASAGAEALVAETREVDDFRSLSVATHGQVTLSRGSQPTVRIEATAETLERLVTEVEDGELRIYRKGAGWGSKPAGPIRMQITYNELDALTLSGSADVSSDVIVAGDFQVAIRGSSTVALPGLEAETLAVSISGSGDLTVAELAAEAVEIGVSGSGDVTLTGQVGTQAVTVRGSGDVDNLALDSREAEAKVSGSGNVRLSVSDSLVARISGSGDISYRGDPEVDGEVSGSGRLRSL